MPQRDISLIFRAAFFLSFFWASAAQADLPEAPVILDSPTGACVPTTDICGDGIDQDCDGSDRLCPAPDQDRDGFTTNDCDDTNRHVYPGISVPCRTTGGLGTKTCQSIGAFSACSVTPLCEATGGGRCYYISALTGSDTNPGTFSSPWKSYGNIVSYYGGSGQPSGWKELRPGDVVYFMSGMYRNTYTYSADTKAMFFRSVNGAQNAPITIKAYPGAHPILTPYPRTVGFSVLQSSYLVIEGFEINRAYQSGVQIAESSNIQLRNLWIHDTDGVDNDNIGGFHVNGSTDVEIHHSLIHDNYDRTNADTGGMKTENSRNMVFFGGGNVRVLHNVIFQSPSIEAPKTGSCLSYKHSASLPGSHFEVGYNILWNCSMVSIGSGSFGSRVHHNLIVNSAPLRIADFGGVTHNEDNVIEFNTFVGGSPLVYDPTLVWGPIGLLTFRKNVVVDHGAYHFERGVITIHVYGGDDVYDATVTARQLSFGSNCYFNPAASLQFNLFNRNGGPYGVKGAIYPFGDWQSLGYDQSSLSVDPRLDADFVPQNVSCREFGAFPN